MDQQELHTNRPDGTFIMHSGPYAGLRTKLMGGNVLKSNNVVVHHHEPLIPYIFDASYAVVPPPDPAAAALVSSPVTLPPKEVVKPQTETYKTNTPTESNPWADLQIVVEDEDEIVHATVVSEREITPTEANQSNDLEPEELIEILVSRDLAHATMTAEEFNALKLSKRQLWKLYSQIIGHTTNKPTVPQAIDAILKRANASGGNYSRVTSAIKRVREQEN